MNRNHIRSTASPPKLSNLIEHVLLVSISETQACGQVGVFVLCTWCKDRNKVYGSEAQKDELLNKKSNFCIFRLRWRSLEAICTGIKRRPYLFASIFCWSLYLFYVWFLLTLVGIGPSFADLRKSFLCRLVVSVWIFKKDPSPTFCCCPEVTPWRNISSAIHWYRLCILSRQRGREKRHPTLLYCWM